MDGPIWRRADDLAFVASPDRAVLVLLMQLQRPPLILNGSAAVVWSAVDGRRTTADVIDEVAARLAVDRQEIHDDVVGFLDTLQGEGLVIADV